MKKQKRFQLNRDDVEIFWVNNYRHLIRLRMRHKPTNIEVETYVEPNNPSITNAQLKELRVRLESDSWLNLTEKVADFLRIPGR